MSRARSTIVGRAVLAAAALLLLLGVTAGCSDLKWRHEQTELRDPDALEALADVLDATTGSSRAPGERS